MSSNSFEKLIQEIGNMSVIEFNDFVKALEDKFGVSAAAMSAGAAPAQLQLLRSSRRKIRIQSYAC